MMAFTVASESSRVHVMKPWSRDTTADRAALPSVASIRRNHGVRGDDLNPISPGTNRKKRVLPSYSSSIRSSHNPQVLIILLLLCVVVFCCCCCSEHVIDTR